MKLKRADQLEYALQDGYAVVGDVPQSMEFAWRMWHRERELLRIQIHQEGDFGRVEGWAPDTLPLTRSNTQSLANLSGLYRAPYAAWAHYFRFQAVPMYQARVLAQAVTRALEPYRMWTSWDEVG